MLLSIYSMAIMNFEITTKNHFILLGGVIMVDKNFSAWMFSYENADNNPINIEKGLKELDLLYDDNFGGMYCNNVCFSFENNRYTFFISNNNIFGISGNPIYYSAGDLFLNAVNIVRYHMQSKYMENGNFRYVSPIINLLGDKFKDYAKLYEKPTVELMKLYYQELLSIGFCEINSMLIVMEFLTNFISGTYNNKRGLLYGSIWHSLDFLPLVGGFEHQDIVKEINNLAPAVFETQIGVYDNKPMILYTNIGIKALYTFDKFQLVQNGFKVRTCEVCNKYFVNVDNKNYHSKVCLDCRNLSQRKRKSNDEFYLAYARAYNAMNNRLRYLPQDGKFRKNYKENYFKPCMEKIKEKQGYYEEKNDLTGFKQFIKKTMDEYKIIKE